MSGEGGVRTVAVVGAGTMGRQIAMACALRGFPTRLVDVSAAALQDARSWMESYLTERQRKGRIDEAAATAARNGLRTTEGLAEAVGGADLVIEAVVEDRKAKQDLFRALDGLAGPDCLLATNSSFIGSSAFAGCLRDPSRLANLHFFHPALVMELVEVVQGPHTSESTAAALEDFCRRLGKTPVRLAREIEGFIVNRVVLAISDAALELYEGGVATPSDIDLAVVKGLGHPMGPFALMDLTGLDLSLRIKRSLFEASGRKPPGLDALAERVEAGALGVKSGRGWFSYPKDPTDRNP